LEAARAAARRALKSSPMEWRRDGYLISTDSERLDRAVIWEFLRMSYWASGATREVIYRSIDNALAFGLYGPSGGQVGFARVVTDHVRFAWLSDVFVLDGHRGKGLGVWLVETVLSHPALVGVRVMLGTADAHGLYERFGFSAADPKRIMDRRSPPT
jgi:GNAT superfamily N-acetyltransferase